MDMGPAYDDSTLKRWPEQSSPENDATLGNSSDSDMDNDSEDENIGKELWCSSELKAILETCFDSDVESLLREVQETSVGSNYHPFPSKLFFSVVSPGTQSTTSCKYTYVRIFLFIIM